jgi:hypothetical protein
VSVILLVAGLVLLGVSTLLEGQAEQTELSCVSQLPESSSCQSSVNAAENNSVTYEGMLGVGVIVAGVGAGLVAAVIIDIMARREVDFPLGPPPPGPSSIPPPVVPGPGAGLPVPPPSAPSPLPVPPQPPSPPLT